MFEIIAPTVGESITEVRIGKWLKNTGELVKVGETVLEIESDKATVEVAATSAGVLQILKQAGETVRVGEHIGNIEEGAVPKLATNGHSAATISQQTTTTTLSPAVKKLVDEKNVDTSKVTGTGKAGRVTIGDVLEHLSETVNSTGSAAALKPIPTIQPAATVQPQGATRRVAMSLLRLKIAERLVQAQHTAAILTTFNECDMTAVMALRAKNKDSFKAKYGTSLSFMSFFTKSVVEALKAVPEVNAQIDGKDIVYYDYYDVGIAVGTQRGLVVPVLRNAGNLSFVEIEKAIAELALKARDGKLTIKELSGGTFTISNGGVYGSLLSTPILNPPQSGILGMHKIQERPIAINGQAAVRPMMNLALSYDHRIVDGQGAVTFLIKVKEGIENPEKLSLDF